MTMLGSHWLPLSVAIPLLGALLSFAAGRRAFAVAAVAVPATVLAAAGLLITVILHGRVSHALAGWAPPLGIPLVADSVSAFLVAVTAGVTGLSSIYAWAYMRGHEESLSPRRFWPLWFFLWAALNALFVAGDAFNLYVTLELVSLSAVGLTALGGSRESLTAALRYLLASLIGSFCYLAAVALLYGGFGTLELAGIAARADGDLTASAALALITGAMLLKSALLPLHFWLPPAHASAPAPVSALLSGLVLKGSVYVLLRYWFDVLPGAQGASDLLGALGSLAILYGSWQAFRQTRLKLLVAYSTVGQVGYLFLVFPIARHAESAEVAWTATLYFIAAHAAAKAGMFLSAGTIQRALGHDELAGMRGMGEALAPSIFAFGIAAASLMGLPPSGGFVAKWLLLNAALTSGQWWWAPPIVLGSLLAAAYLFRVLHIVLTGPQPDELPHRPTGAMHWPALALALLAAALGFFAVWPLEFVARAAP